MTQNTEQNVRTRNEQIAALSTDIVCGAKPTGMPEYELAAYHIRIAEARGAEEQRRKDAEETRHLWDHLATINNYGFQFDPEKDDPKKLADACIKAAREAIENPPAEVAALEEDAMRYRIVRQRFLEDARNQGDDLTADSFDAKVDGDMEARAALTREGGV